MKSDSTPPSEFVTAGQRISTAILTIAIVIFAIAIGGLAIGLMIRAWEWAL